MLRKLAIITLLVITLVTVQLWVMSYRKLPVVHFASDPHVVLAAFEGRLGVIWSDRPIWPALATDTPVQLHEPPCRCSVPGSLFTSQSGTLASTIPHRIVPLWLIALPSAAILTALLITPLIRAERRQRCGCCEACGYSLTGLPADHRCPECGAETPAAAPTRDTSHPAPPLNRPLSMRRTRRLAIAAAIGFYVFAGTNTAWLMLGPEYEACPLELFRANPASAFPQPLDDMIEHLKRQHRSAPIDFKQPLQMDPIFEQRFHRNPGGKHMPSGIADLFRRNPVNVLPPQLEKLIEDLKKQQRGAPIDFNLPLRKYRMFDEKLQEPWGKRMPADIVESSFFPSG